MVPDANRWNIVILGEWNVRIFNDVWVGKHLLTDQKLHLEFDLNQRTLTVTGEKDGIVIVPFPNKLTIGLKKITDETLRSIEQAAVKVLKELPHTPVKAVGINFGFNENDPSDMLTQLFQFKDDPAIESWGASCKEYTINRSLRKDGETININQKYSPSTGNFLIDFNYHRDVADTNSIIEAIEDKIILYRDRTIDFLNTVYSVGIESDNGSS